MKKKKTKFKFHKLLIVAGIVIFQSYLILTIIMQQFSIAESQQELAAYQQELTDEQEKSAQLDSQMQQQNDPAYMEQMAREKLGLYKSTEKIFIDGSNR